METEVRGKGGEKTKNSWVKLEGLKGERKNEEGRVRRSGKERASDIVARGNGEDEEK